MEWTEKRRREEGRRGSGYLFESFSEEEEERRGGWLGLRGNPGVAHRPVPQIHKLNQAREYRVGSLR